MLKRLTFSRVRALVFSREQQIHKGGDSSEAERTCNKTNIWDDPWSKAIQKQKTVTEVEEIDVDWKHVDRLMPHRVIPEVPKHSSYPTPSGWRPPNPRPGLPFHVARRRNHLLPLFLETKRDQLNPETMDYNYVELVVLRNVQGDVFKCEESIKKWLEERVGHPVATNVDELKGIIRFRGADRSLLECCLYDFGF